MSRPSFILWVVLLIGIWVKWRFHLPPEKGAAVYQCAPDTLVINHQIVANDLQTDDDQNENDAYIGRYLVAVMKKGDIIEPKDLTASPIIPPIAKDSAMMILPLRDDEIVQLKTLDAGDHIYLVPALISDTIQNKSINAPNSTAAAKVIAVHLATAETPGNWLWIQFPVTSNQNVAAFAAAQKRIITKASD